MKREKQTNWLMLMLLMGTSHLMANEVGTLFFSPAERIASASNDMAERLRIQGVTRMGTHWVVWLGKKAVASQEMIAGWQFVGMKHDQLIFVSRSKRVIHLAIGDLLPDVSEPATRISR